MPVRFLPRFLAGLSPTQRRFAAFVALSLALHLITVVGAGPFDPAARRPGASPGREPLHATLVPGDSPAPAPAPSPVADRPAPAVNAATAPAPARDERPAPAEPAPAGGGLALPAADKWYAANEVDVRAEPLTEVRLRYPEGVPGSAVGRVRLRLFIDEGGVVRKLQIAASEPAGLFDEAARETWQEVRFTPARKNGAAVKSQKLIELTYQPTGQL